MKLVASLVICLVATAAQAKPAAPPHAIVLPGAGADGVFMDYLAYDRARHRLFVPAGNSGMLDVIDAGSDAVRHVDGFVTRAVERNGKKRVVGPSSATIAGDVVYVGNRGDSSVCAVDAASLRKGACVTLDSMPDGLAWVAATREIWVTTPRDKSITILESAPALRVKQKLTLEGEPEGYAVDDARGLFYTNLEDNNRTLQIDVRTRRVAHTWTPGCGDDGPRGLALDHAANFLFVACVDKVELLDAAHDGKALGALATGAGVDNIDYVEARHQLFAAAGRAATLTIATIDAKGAFGATRVVPTSAGARNAVAGDDGTAYVADSAGGRILVVAPAR